MVFFYPQNQKRRSFTITKPKTLEQLRAEKERAETLGSEVILTPEDGHSYGFYSDKAYVKRIVVENTVDFFEDKLKK